MAVLGGWVGFYGRGWIFSRYVLYFGARACLLSRWRCGRGGIPRIAAVAIASTPPGVLTSESQTRPGMALIFMCSKYRIVVFLFVWRPLLCCGAGAQVDPTVFHMLNEDPGGISFSEIGGLGEQIRELREVIELPLTNPELFIRVGIKPPKVCAVFRERFRGQAVVRLASLCCTPGPRLGPRCSLFTQRRLTLGYSGSTVLFRRNLAGGRKTDENVLSRFSGSSKPKVRQCVSAVVLLSCPRVAITELTLHKTLRVSCTVFAAPSMYGAAIFVERCE